MIQRFLYSNNQNGQNIKASLLLIDQSRKALQRRMSLCCRLFTRIVCFLAIARIASVAADGLATRGIPPSILSVTPNFGSVEGGTWITLEGANFLQSGLFTNRFVYVGTDKCTEIQYFTTDTSLTCVVPKCGLPQCLQTATWTGSVQATVSFQVQTVEGLLTASDTFTYHGGWTPAIYKMSKYIRGGSLFHVEGATRTSSVDDIDIKIGDYRGEVGDPGEYNSATLSIWSNQQRVNYKAPEDLVAGYFNLTMTNQNDQSSGWRGTGKARMFPKQKAFPTWKYPYGYNFDSTMTGKVFSVALLPSIRSISPSLGSIGGGTVVTITGSGFSKIGENNIVYVAGRACGILTSDHEEITCQTAAGNSSEFANSIYLSDASNFTDITLEPQEVPVPFFSKSLYGNSTRQSGSPGWWVKMWSYADYYYNRMTDNYVDVEYAIKGEMANSLYYLVGSDWTTKMGFVSSWTSAHSFAADHVTNLIAPITGNYTFFINSDDTSYLYASHITSGSDGRDILAGEKLIKTSYYAGALDDIYTNQKDRMSETISLQRGETLRLRCRLINSVGADYLKIGLKIEPKYEENGMLSDFAPNRTYVQNEHLLPSLANLTSSAFLQHHAWRDVQIVSLSMKYQYEIQVRGVYVEYVVGIVMVFIRPDCCYSRN